MRMVCRMLAKLALYNFFHYIFTNPRSVEIGSFRLLVPYINNTFWKKRIYRPADVIFCYKVYISSSSTGKVVKFECQRQFYNTANYNLLCKRLSSESQIKIVWFSVRKRISRSSLISGVKLIEISGHRLKNERLPICIYLSTVQRSWSKTQYWQFKLDPGAHG